MKRLTKLANKYKTDKGTTYEWSHGFTEFYEPYFAKYEHPVILELGVERGSAEKMLNDFYDGDCTIYCVDMNDLSHLFTEYENIKFFQCDLSKKEEIDQLMAKLWNVKFDIIIDDASHLWFDQFLALSMLNKLLKKDGIYVLEDLHTSFRTDIWGDNKEFTDSPLYFLNRMDTGEHTDLVLNIKDVIIYNHTNPCNTMVDPPRSITSIITFRD